MTVDNTMLVVIGSIATKQSKPTSKTLKAKMDGVHPKMSPTISFSVMYQK